MPIPGIAMAPLFILWFGFGTPTIIATGAVATFFPVSYYFNIGVRNVDPSLVRMARLMGIGPLGITLKVLLPWAAALSLTGLRLGLARCWRTVVAVEFIAATDWGLGYMIWEAAEYLRSGIVLGGIVLLGCLFVFVDRGLFGFLESRTIEKWGLVK
jgi:ABC-type nitrate/sulfonate/bicarbonate transport system permease component